MSNHIIINIGKKIREIRNHQDIKLQEIADASQISKGMLSKIENGRTVPSLPVLLAIIAALKVDMRSFFDNLDLGEKKLYIHKKKTEYPLLEKEDAHGFLYHSILSQSINQCIIDVVILDLKPGSQRDKVTTDGFELKYIIKGQVVYELGDESITLEEGDTLFFDGKIPHVPINKTDSPVSMLVIYFLIPEVGN